MSKDLVFIVSAGRTGTEFLGRKLSTMIDGAFSVHEPDIFYGPFDRRSWPNIRAFGLYHMVIGRILKRTGSRVLATQYRLGELSHVQVVRRVRKSRERYFASRPESLVIESNLQWSLILPVLRDAFPKAKVIVVTRDKESWVRSWMRRGDRYTERDVVRDGRLNPKLLGDPVAGPLWDGMSVEEKLNWEWTYTNDALLAFAETDPLTRRFRYEDLFLAADRANHFRQLLDFAARHGERHYPVSFDPAALDERINAS
ncbi:sulfotransferase [Jiella marina]|uniref:sulfotransferase n=1 Tax=Jiella sp. LLJ827 TaxID=2917712 RepID=UPI00210114D9|nr:sulfotransferase [Jiella sp. LLJ827]MCQ0987653.1 hypothetical protein [Jiella sp. LLJ827]